MKGSAANPMTSTTPHSSKSGNRTITGILALIPLLASLAVLVWGFFFLRDIQLAKDSNIPQVVTVLMAIIWGVGGVRVHWSCPSVGGYRLNARSIRSHRSSKASGVRP